MSNRLIVANETLLAEQGETGVRVHFNLIRELLNQQGITVSVIHPYQTNKWQQLTATCALLRAVLLIFLPKMLLEDQVWSGVRWVMGTDKFRFNKKE